jgi:uncharacterized Zn-binding protein involved in type VI secretion
MFIKRYHITESATTTAGGVVRMSSKGMRLNGARVALEGDPVDCPACGAQGVIKCVMPRLVDRFGDKEYALSDDLCICGCNPPPKLIANQNFRYQSLLCIEGEPPGKATTQQTGTAAKAVTPHVKTSPLQEGRAKQANLRPLRFLIRGTGRPYANRPYRLDLGDGNVVQGETDANGFTRPLSPDERAALRTWQSGGR